jgi:hypothetical protein
MVMQVIMNNLLSKFKSQKKKKIIIIIIISHEDGKVPADEDSEFSPLAAFFFLLDLQCQQQNSGYTTFMQPKLTIRNHINRSNLKLSTLITFNHA